MRLLLEQLNQESIVLTQHFKPKLLPGKIITSFLLGIHKENIFLKKHVTSVSTKHKLCTQKFGVNLGF